MRVLIAVASRHGSTRRIAETIGDRLRDAGHRVDVTSVDEVGDLSQHDAVVLGSAVYIGQWMKAARRFAERHTAELRARPVWLFSSGPLGRPPRPVPSVEVDEIVTATGAAGHQVFAGVLRREGLSVSERALVTALRAEEGDFRDWEAIDAWAAGIAAALADRAGG